MTDQIEIDGHTYELGEWEVRSGIGVPDSLTAEISKGPALTPACPPFTFGGSTWHLTGLTVSNNTSTGSLTMKLEATTKTIPYRPRCHPGRRCRRRAGCACRPCPRQAQIRTSTACRSSTTPN